jgi:monovalent cation:H+ antiporter-2, CPA2 family
MRFTDAVPETVEASLRLSEATLIGLGLQKGPVIASIHDKRYEFRISIADRCRASRLQTTRAICEKALRW